AIDQARAVIRNLLPGRLDQVYAAIAQRAPSARTVVVGYPRLFNGEDCNAGTWFSPSEMQRLNDTADLLNATTRARATAAGFDHVDPTTAFLGHAVCSDTEWINGLSNPVNESYHPNRTGQQGYADVVDDVLLS
ncbi:MAG: SGNH/GDSL hydrolase family protein, partial [Stackebrandtia sp.]